MIRPYPDLPASNSYETDVFGYSHTIYTVFDDSENAPIQNLYPFLSQPCGNLLQEFVKRTFEISRVFKDDT